MMITEVTCDNCSYSRHGKGIFNPDSSHSFKYLTKPDEQEDIVIGEYTVTGYWGIDTIELVTESTEVLTVNDFSFFLVTHIEGTQERILSGVIGLGVPQTQNPDWPTTNLVQTLCDDG